MEVEQDKRALEGVRVLEIADERGVYCGKLLADMGADVVKVEEPGGDLTRNIPPFWGDEPGPDRSLPFLYMNTNKRSVTLDLTRAKGQVAFRELAKTADILLETSDPGYMDSLGLGYARLKKENPGLIYTSISGFGQTGPRKDFKSSNIVAAALGGAMYATGDKDGPPVVVPGSEAYLSASEYAAAGSLIALYYRLQTGEGQLVDISMMEAIAACAALVGPTKWLDDHIVTERMGGKNYHAAPSGAYTCKDGLIYITAHRAQHWKALAEWIHEVTGITEVLDPIFDGVSSMREPNRDLLDMYVSDFTSRSTVAEIFHEAQKKRHITVSPVYDFKGVTEDPHFKARGYFIEVEHGVTGKLKYPGAPYRFSGTPWAVRRPAPKVGEHNGYSFDQEPGISRNGAVEFKSTRPNGVTGNQTVAHPRESQALRGVRVVEFTTAQAGPWVGRHMAYCGAEVIRVESSSVRPDVARTYVPPWAPEKGLQPQLSPRLTAWNCGKRFVAIKLADPRGIELSKRLVKTADVVITNHRPGIMERLGLDYPVLKQVKPDIVMLSSSGFGLNGPYRSYIAFGPNLESIAGLSASTGFPWNDCVLTPYIYSDEHSALHGLVAVMCALVHRAKTGMGQHIDLAQSEAVMSTQGHVMMEFLATGKEPQKLGNRLAWSAPHGCYRCRGEDRWCAIAVLSDAEWDSFCGVIGRPGWTNDPRFADSVSRLRNGDDLDILIETWTVERTPHEVMNAMQQAGVRAGVVQIPEEMLRSDPQFAARKFYEEVEHLVLGKVLADGIPLGLTTTPGRHGLAGQAVGQDNEYVFRKLLGLTQDEFDEYLAVGAIEQCEGDSAAGGSQ